MEERRSGLRRAAAALAGAAALAAPPSHACQLPGAARVLDSARYALAYRTQPERIAVGEHFTLELAVCAKRGARLRERVGLSAHMPEHRHGMNYLPSLSALGAGRYRSQGWLFHMPGHWEFVFEIGAERLTDSVRVE